MFGIINFTFNFTMSNSNNPNTIRCYIELNFDATTYDGNFNDYNLGA